MDILINDYINGERSLCRDEAQFSAYLFQILNGCKRVKIDSVTIPYPDAEEIKEIKNGALITLRVSGDLENLQALQYTTEHGQGIVLMPLQNNK